jgi:hypothetical protein
MASSSNHGSSSMGDGSSSSLSEDEILEQLFVGMDRQIFCLCSCFTNSFDMFNANELKESTSQLVDLGMGV